MKNIFAFNLLIFSAMQMLNGDKRLLVSDPQYAQNLWQAFDVKLEKLNNHVVQQDSIISSLQSNFTNATQRLETQDTKYQETAQKLEAQEAINHILLSRLSTQESLNNKLTGDLNNKTNKLNEHLVHQNQQFSNDTKELTSQLSVLRNTITQLSSDNHILSQQLLNQSQQLNHLQGLASTAQPAFHVVIRTPAHYGLVPVPEDTNVVFKSKLLDVGNGYNTQTGKYNVTRSGIYVITWTISVYGQYRCVTRLMVNDVVKGSVATDGEDTGSNDDVSTNIVVINLSVGDQLHIRQHGDSRCQMFQDSYKQTSFSGWFLN